VVVAVARGGAKVGGLLGAAAVVRVGRIPPGATVSRAIVRVAAAGVGGAAAGGVTTRRQWTPRNHASSRIGIRRINQWRPPNLRFRQPRRPTIRSRFGLG